MFSSFQFRCYFLFIYNFSIIIIFINFVDFSHVEFRRVFDILCEEGLLVRLQGVKKSLAF